MSQTQQEKWFGTGRRLGFADSLPEGVRFWLTGKTDPDTRGDVNLFMVPRSH